MQVTKLKSGETNMESVLKGREWTKYMEENHIKTKGQLELYRCTHRYVPIYKLGDYYFSFKFCRGYKNLASLKRLV
jgi:hypothetical protein